MILYGAGGHAKVIRDCLEACGKKVSFIFDDNSSIKKMDSTEVVAPYDPALHVEEELIISVGNNLTRKRISEKTHHKAGKVIHPSVILSPSSEIGIGSAVLQGSIIQAAAKIGKYCIVNTAAIIEHDCLVADFVHIAPRATICGGVTIGEGTFTGAGATVIENVTIGKWCIIAAGSVIIKDVPDFSMVAGVPGKIIKSLATTI